MSQYPVAVVVGSLRRDPFNRKLANAVARLAPAEFSFKQVRIDDLPLYNQDDDAQPADSVKLEGRNQRRPRTSLRDPRIQPLAPRRVEERGRSPFAPLRPERSSWLRIPHNRRGSC